MKSLVFTVFFFAACAASAANAYAWTLLSIITDSETQINEEPFNPEEDIVFLPKIEDKELFAAIDDLSIVRKKEVRRFINLYLNNGRSFTIRGIERSSLYKDIIDDVFAENPDIPADLAFLPLLESGFNPRAVSRSKAVGLWQFMKNTSEPLGLKNNKWIDDRRSIEKSTRAAVRHLRGLYNTFGSWELALAAYNGGGGHVRKSMNKSGATDFWSLHQAGVLHNETAEYVPRFIALLLIYRNQGLFNIADEINPKVAAQTDTIKLKYSVPLNAVSRFSGSSIDTIFRFNPELSFNATPPAASGYELRLPSANIRRLESNIENLYKHRIQDIKTKAYTVKKGDTLSAIAQKNGTKLSVIMRVNNIKDGNRIMPGKVLRIPAK